MSTVKAKNHQIGNDGTASNNFTIYQPSTPDGTSRWAVGVSGATTADVVTVTNAGNVNIGQTSTPSGWGVQAKVSVKQSSSSGGAGFLAFSSTNENAIFLGYDSTNSLGRIGVSYGSTGSFTPLVFETGGSERMRIDSSGRVCINNTTSAGGQPLYVKALNGVGSAGFQVWQNASGAVDWYNASATYVASVIVNASSVAYNTTSDYRLKDDIAPMTGALDKVAQLKPVNWKWKLDGSDGQGFIAHELQSVIPDAVSGEKDAVNEDGSPKYQGVDTSFLVATLTAAIQEQQTIIETLKADIAELKAKVN